jgi:hypothetical protein
MYRHLRPGFRFPNQPSRDSVTGYFEPSHIEQVMLQSPSRHESSGPAEAVSLPAPANSLSDHERAIDVVDAIETVSVALARHLMADESRVRHDPALPALRRLAGLIRTAGHQVPPAVAELLKLADARPT